MNVKIIYDVEENEYISFVPRTRTIGYGQTEKESLIDFLHQCEKDPIYNQKVISELLNKIQ